MSERADWRRQLEASTETDAAPSRTDSARPAVPALTVLYHPDLERVGEQALLLGVSSGRSEDLSRLAPAFAAPRSQEPRPLADPGLTRRPFRLSPGTEPGGLLLERQDARSRLATSRLGLDERLEITASEVDSGLVLILAERVVLLLHRVDPLPAEPAPDLGLVGQSDAVEQVRQAISRVADLDTPVLIRGETGTGKELVAEAIHRCSSRRAGPWVAVNMAAIPPSLAAAELFGVRRGAYTGASKELPGYFRRANGGTLFLDELGETPREIQALLLRSLENGEVQPVGASHCHSVDLRVVTATDAELDSAVAKGAFSAPLFHRLSGLEINLPPLRERREDFGLLLRHFLRQELEAYGVSKPFAAPGGKGWLPATAVARLAACSWPGNVRQLRNVVRRLVVASYPDRPLPETEVERLFAEANGIAMRHPPPAGDHTERPKARKTPGRLNEEELVDALSSHGWQIRPAARTLGISRTSLYALIDRFPGLRRASELNERQIADAIAERGGDLVSAADRLRVSIYSLRQRLRELKPDLRDGHKENGR